MGVGNARLHLFSIMRGSSLVPIANGPSAVSLACQLLTEGNIIAVPTDTIYGLAASAQNSQALQRLYAVKGRDLTKPLAVCVGNVEDIPLWGKADVLPAGLLETLLPGPVTVVLERTTLLNEKLNPNISKVGIRVPDHPFVREVAQRIAKPLALTSANRSNEPSSLNPEEFKPLWPCLAAIFDAGLLGSSSTSRMGSTVVDLSVQGRYHILRNGSAVIQTIKTLRNFGLEPLSEGVKNFVL